MQSALPEQLGETRKAFGVSLAALAAAHPGQKLPREQQVPTATPPRLLHYGYASMAVLAWLCDFYEAGIDPTSPATSPATCPYLPCGARTQTQTQTPT